MPDLLTKISLSLLSSVVVLTAVITPALAQQETASPDAQVQGAQADLEGVEGQVKSIDEQVAQVENSLRTTEAKRVETEAEIKKLSEQSTGLVPALQAKTNEYQRRRGTLRTAMNADYKTAPRDTLLMMAESGSITETLAKSTYTASIEQRISALAVNADEARDGLDSQKRELDGKRSSLEVLNRQITAIRGGIEQQRAELAELRANRTNEATYLSEKIARAKQQQDMLLQASANGTPGALWGTYTEGAQVRQGDVIGFEGSTGNSTGCHLHFSVIKDGKWVDPGSFWSMLAHPSGKQTQAYGMTGWAQSGAYGGSIHNGLDIVQGCGSPIRAAADGVIVRDNRTDGSGFGHYLMIRHTDGLMTLYGHLI